jgi:hypothetical protein
MSLNHALDTRTTHNMLLFAKAGKVQYPATKDRPLFGPTPFWILEAAVRMDSLIQVLLTYGRLSQVENVGEEIGLEEEVQTALRMLEPQIRAAEVRSGLTRRFQRSQRTVLFWVKS